MMSGIRSRNTKPEIAVRKWLHQRGYRYRLHVSHLPGHPDVVLPRYRVAIFVHGCFWHRHAGCKLAYTPKSNIDRWMAKFRENMERDAAVRSVLDAQGWRQIVVWECEVRNGSFMSSLRDSLIALNACSPAVRAEMTTDTPEPSEPS